MQSVGGILKPGFAEEPPKELLKNLDSQPLSLEILIQYIQGRPWEYIFFQITLIFLMLPVKNQHLICGRMIMVQYPMAGPSLYKICLSIAFCVYTWPWC